MKRAYKRRPNDFKRRIIKRGIPKKKLHEEEHKWLSLIKPHELRSKYYNLRNHKFNNWTNLSKERIVSIREKISKGVRSAYDRPEYREKMQKNVWSKNTTWLQTPEVKSKRANSNRGQKRSNETREKMRQAQLTPAAIERNRNKMLGEKNFFYGKKLIGELNGFYGKQHSDKTRKLLSDQRKGNKIPNWFNNTGTSWWNNGKESVRSIECPGPEWSKGKGKSWWNNGVENIQSFKQPGDGWVEGMLPKKKEHKLCL